MIQCDPAPPETPEITDSSLVSTPSRQGHSENISGQSLESAQTVNISYRTIGPTNPAKRLEELLRSLDSMEAPAPNSNITRKDTGWAIAQLNNYRSEGLVPNDLSLHNSQAIEEEQEQTVSEGITENAGTVTASTSLSKIASSESTQEKQSSSIPQQASGKTKTRAVYANIHYRRILTCVFLFQFTFQILFALALGGVFGEEGYLVASCFLVVLIAVAVFVVVDGTRQRLMEIKGTNGRPATRS